MIIVSKRKSAVKARQIVERVLVCMGWADYYQTHDGRYAVRYDGTKEQWSHLVQRWAHEDGEFSVRWGCGFLRP